MHSLCRYTLSRLHKRLHTLCLCRPIKPVPGALPTRSQIHFQLLLTPRCNLPNLRRRMRGSTLRRLVKIHSMINQCLMNLLHPTTAPACRTTD
jgi:hypothetical protein